MFLKLVEALSIAIEALKDLDWSTILSTVLGTLISAVVAFKVAKYQVDKSKQQQQEQIDENRRLEKELFFYKSRHEVLSESINSLSEVIETFKSSLSTIKNLDSFHVEIYDHGLENAYKKLMDQIYEPLEKIEKFESIYTKILWKSYFDDERLVSLERKVESESVRVRILFNWYAELAHSLINSENRDALCQALEKYLFNELMILQQEYSILFKINSLYFVNHNHEQATIFAILKARDRDVSFMESERDEWKKLIDEGDLQSIEEKLKKTITFEGPQ